MNQPRYREYFVGGPFHGQDRLDLLDTVQITYTGMILYRIPEDDLGLSVPMYDLGIFTSMPVSREGHYALRRFRFCRSLVNAWVDYTETEESAEEKLTEIMLAPHKR